MEREKKKKQGAISLSFLQDLKQKLEKSMEQAEQISQRYLEMSRLMLRIKTKKDELERLVHRLGWEVYEAWKPEKEWTKTPAIAETLREVLEMEEQIKAMEKELEELKTSNIVSTKVDLVDISKLSPVSRSEEAGRAEMVSDVPSKPETVQKEPVREERKTLTHVLYLCPYCAHQVTVDAPSCAHCHQRFY
jgi:uncharacterized protein with ATP-grasp and redox domains